MESIPSFTSFEKRAYSFRRGDYHPLPLQNKNLIAFIRSYQDKSCLTLLNLSADAISTSEIDLQEWGQEPLIGDMVISEGMVTLQPFTFAIWNR